MRRTADYQLRLQAADNATNSADINYEWVRGVFYTGVMALYETTKDQQYLDAPIRYSERRKWQLDKPETRHADWQCIGQVYLELYLMDNDPVRIAAIRQNIDAQMAAPLPGRVDWWWCDALYMAPPVLARLYKATGDRKYLEYLDAMYWDAYEFLYDPEEQLFFRDEKFFDAKTKSGHKAFWSRGNGWVLGGLARILDYLPADEPGRARYVELFREMSRKVAALQSGDGLWRSALLDEDEYPTGETSGTAFFVYALAWGINRGVLNRDDYEAAVLQGWRGLVGAVTPEGRLTHVQTVAAAPGPVMPDDTREYAVGAFLLAGSELVKLLEPQADDSPATAEAK